MPNDTVRRLGGANTPRPTGAPVKAFVALGEAARESGSAVRQSGTLTPIIERERALMPDRWALAHNGNGQLVVVSDEAGIGMSRITLAVIGETTQDHADRITSPMLALLGGLSVSSGHPADAVRGRKRARRAAAGGGDDGARRRRVTRRVCPAPHDPGHRAPDV